MDEYLNLGLGISNICCYKGTGWDIGAFQFHALQNTSYDYLLYIGSNTRFNFQQFPTFLISSLHKLEFDLIGFSSSREISPHIRTNVFIVKPSFFLSYPITIINKNQCARFEHSSASIYRFCIAAGMHHTIALKSGLMSLEEALLTPGSFRSGMQDNLIFHDRHTDIYALASIRKKIQLELLKEGMPLHVMY